MRVRVHFGFIPSEANLTNKSHGHSSATVSYSISAPSRLFIRICDSIVDQDKGQAWAFGTDLVGLAPLILLVLQEIFSPCVGSQPHASPRKGSSTAKQKEKTEVTGERRDVHLAQKYGKHGVVRYLVHFHVPRPPPCSRKTRRPGRIV